MKKNEDKRLLGAIEHIDDRYVDEAAEKIKARTAGTAGGVSKKRVIKQVAILAACLVLLSAAIPVATTLINNIPEVTNPAGSAEGSSNVEAPEPVEPELPEEYFTTGRIYYAGSPALGLEYEGYWIYMTSPYGVGRDHIAKYDPVTDTASSVCIDSSCKHTVDSCPLSSPLGWDLNFMDISGDWLVYDFSTSSSSGNGPDGTKLCAYNMKTGEARVILEKTEEGNLVKYVSTYHVMGEKVYLLIREIDNSNPQEKKTRDYIASYDLSTGETVYMFEKPEGMSLIAITNKRFFFIGKRSGRYPVELWTTDYTGGELKKEEVLDFDPVILCGTYAYSAVSLLESGNCMEVYDLATDSKFTIDFGEKVRYLLADSGKLGFVTSTAEDEYEGTTRFYLTDARGENRELVFEDDKMMFNPYRIVGNYVICVASYADGSKNIGGTIDVLNLETGKITPMKILKFEE